MHRSLVLVPLALLAACGTPQEQCIGRATKDLRVVEKLVVETQRNIDRGYAIEEYTVIIPEWEECEQRFDKKGRPLPPRMCLEDREETRTRPVAVDLNAETAKLESLLSKRDQLRRESSGRIDACRQQYPE